MKCMGLRRLTIVGSAPVDFEAARILAIHAGDVLDEMQMCESLEAALEESALSAGVTRRRGKRRKCFSMLPEELAEEAVLNRDGTTAIVFGNEESGLTDRELSYCNLAVNIPSSPLFPSLNLSHAVQIIAYHIYRQMNAGNISGYTPIDRGKLDRLISIILTSLGNIGFFKQVAPEDMGIFFRDILGRARLSGREAKRFEMVFRKISGLGAGKGISP
jgi:tRNA/rRNA methyltransferase